MDKTTRTIIRQESGFSLAELLVGVAIGSIVMALIATAFWSQTKSSSNQQLMVEMQQNIRAGLFFMQRDIVMAGYEDSRSFLAGATITNADSTQIEFTLVEPYSDEDNIDNNNDGTVDEGDVDNPEEKDGIDNNGDGDIDEINELETIRYVLQGNELHRVLVENATNAVRQDEVIAYNIDRLEFFYTQDDGDTGTTFATQGARNDIRRVGISILARSEFDVRGYTNTETYTAMSGAVWGPFGDNFQRELVTTTVLCRNMLR